MLEEIYLHALLLGQTRLWLNVCHDSEIDNIKGYVRECFISQRIGQTLPDQI